MSTYARRGPLHDVAGLGLGCSRFGSVVNGVDRRAAETLVDVALDLGIRYFDTADIYGQGDSEVFLGRALRRHRQRAMIGTKVGQRFTSLQRALRPLKSPLKRLGGAVLRRRLSSAREAPLPRCYEPAYLIRAVETSLRRLGRETIDLVYLHSPSAAALRDGSAIDALESLRVAGKVGLIGVSCDDLDAAREALRDDRVRVLQIPLHLPAPATDDLLCQARRRGLGVVARSVSRGGAAAEPSPEARRHLFQSALRRPDLDVVLLGTTKPAHLREIAECRPT